MYGLNYISIGWYGVSLTSLSSDYFFCPDYPIAPILYIKYVFFIYLFLNIFHISGFFFNLIGFFLTVYLGGGGGGGCA